MADDEKFGEELDGELEGKPENRADNIEPLEEPAREQEVAIALEKSDVGGGNGGGVQSYTEASESMNKDTDLQATLKRLFPQFPIKIINMVAQSAMVARIDPNWYLDSFSLTVDATIFELDADGEDFNVQAVIDMVLFAFSIGLEGKGRADGLELAGSYKEAEIEKAEKSLWGS